MQSVKKNVVINEDPANVATTNDCWLRCHGLQLYKKDELILLSLTAWLNDNHINAAMHLLHAQFPEINGFQDTLRQSINGYEPSLHPFIQITLVCNSHWVCVSSLNCESNEVKVYDSLCYPLSTNSTSVSQLVHTDKDKITLKQMDVQQQSSTSDCGVFAIAYAASICHGENPCMLHYHQPGMRQHLKTCLEDGHIKPFPSQKRKIKQDVLALHVVRKQL